ncbi:hypothetical protein [Thiolinea disciformis]|uniref:hypothetical protein n=1 Tax=Thiolinea disciformis TaxID=125614 RepID=UPI00036D0C3A|nr:hypothetical protein [Thiolinea disciformis]
MDMNNVSNGIYRARTTRSIEVLTPYGSTDWEKEEGQMVFVKVETIPSNQPHITIKIMNEQHPIYSGEYYAMHPISKMPVELLEKIEL